jgi:N-acetylmuramoyl-L-alanine amidase
VAVLTLVPCVLGAIAIDRACTAPPAVAAQRAAAAPPPGADRSPTYAAGACQAQAPTGRSRNQTVLVDPGHGGPDPGVIGQPTARAPAKESEAALAVATELARRLRADGYRVVLSRTANTSVRRFATDQLTDGSLDSTQVRQDLQARVRCANDSRAAVLLSIHFNGYADGTVGGSQTIYDDVRPFADRSQRLASSIQQVLLQQLGLDDRGVVTDGAVDAPTLSDRAESYGHLLLLGPAEPGWLDRGTTMPGALVEPLFLTKPSEANLATSQGGQRRIAQALASGLERYLANTANGPTQ